MLLQLDMVGFFGGGASSSHAAVLPRNGSKTDNGVFLRCNALLVGEKEFF
tara:strand:- start:602 stop:751 length:150 start_codon:yes stop_codon:yes gene_type:complete